MINVFRNFSYDKDNLQIPYTEIKQKILHVNLLSHPNYFEELTVADLKEENQGHIPQRVKNIPIVTKTSKNIFKVACKNIKSKEEKEKVAHTLLSNLNIRLETQEDSANFSLKSQKKKIKDKRLNGFISPDEVVKFYKSKLQSERPKSKQITSDQQRRLSFPFSIDSNHKNSFVTPKLSQRQSCKLQSGGESSQQSKTPKNLKSLIKKKKAYVNLNILKISKTFNPTTNNQTSLFFTESGFKSTQPTETETIKRSNSKKFVKTKTLNGKNLSSNLRTKLRSEYDPHLDISIDFPHLQTQEENKNFKLENLLRQIEDLTEKESAKYQILDTEKTVYQVRQKDNFFIRTNFVENPYHNSKGRYTQRPERNFNKKVSPKKKDNLFNTCETIIQRANTDYRTNYKEQETKNELYEENKRKQKDKRLKWQQKIENDLNQEIFDYNNRLGIFIYDMDQGYHLGNKEVIKGDRELDELLRSQVI